MANQSRNRRLLCLKKIFEEETDIEHGITMALTLNDQYTFTCSYIWACVISV